MTPTTPDDADRQPTTSELEAREWGPARAPTPGVGELPAGGGVWAVPHYATKVGLVNQIARAYRWTFDEAVKHCRQNALAMLRDCAIRDALQTRATPLLQLSWHLEPQDETDPEQVRAAKKVEGVLRRTPRLLDLHASMSWAIWYGRAGSQLLWEWDYSHPDGEKRLVVRDHRPINGDSLVARWGGDWGVLVNAFYPGEKQPTDRGFAHFFDGREREAVVIHTHECRDADYYEPELAGQVRGVGARDAVYWYWYLASNFRGLLVDFAERFAAGGIVKGYYDETNPEAKSELADAIADYKTNSAFLLPRNKGTGMAVNDVEVVPVSTLGPQFLQEIISDFYQQIRQLITGSQVDRESSVSVGGDAIGVDEDRVSRVVKLDAERLADTYTRDLVAVACRYNCGPTVPPPRWVFDCDTPNAGAIFNFADALMSRFGSTVDVDHLHAISGVQKGGPGDSLASKLNTLNPIAAANPAPAGVPMAAPQQPTPAAVPQTTAVDTPVATA